MIRHNPELKAIEYSRAPLVRPKSAREIAEEKLPWLIFSQYEPTKCRSCGNATSTSFCAAKSMASAKSIFRSKHAYCGVCMARRLTDSEVRITTMGWLSRTSKLIFSPYRVFSFMAEQPIVDNCGKPRREFFVIATDQPQAILRKDKYSMCGWCICEMLAIGEPINTNDPDKHHWAIQTTDGETP
jgi:hypothetical protein